jgi:hypothetical protein
MLTLEYHPDGLCVPDAKTMQIAKSFVAAANDTSSHTILFSQAMLLDAFRVLIKRGDVDPTRVVIRFENNAMYCNRDGHVSDWPRGFCDHTENYLMELLS